VSQRFLLACGGTGGHLSPGIALAETLTARGHHCTLLISSKQIDSRLGKKYAGLDFVRMPGTGFSIHPVRFARFVSSQASAITFSTRLLRRLRPDFVIGFGGFTTAAVAYAARALGVPVALHEANRVPGRAIRFAGAIAHRVYLPPGVRPGRLRASVVRHCGLPVRRELVRLPRARARAALGLNPEGRTLVVLGGSQGARPLNDWVKSALPQFAQDGIQVVCVTGPQGGAAAGTLEHHGRDERAVRTVFMPFCDDMATLLSAADLVVSRSGAGTIAELVRMHVPAILVPFPQAADNHQEANARFFEQQGGGFVVMQPYLADLAREVREVMANDWLLSKFRQNLHRLDRDDPAEIIADDLARELREMEAAVSRPREVGA